MRGFTVPCAWRNVPTQVTARDVRGYVAVKMRPVTTNTDVLVFVLLWTTQKTLLNTFKWHHQQCDIFITSSQSEQIIGIVDIVTHVTIKGNKWNTMQQWSNQNWIIGKTFFFCLFVAPYKKLSSVIGFLNLCSWSQILVCVLWLGTFYHYIHTYIFLKLLLAFYFISLNFLINYFFRVSYVLLNIYICMYFF